MELQFIDFDEYFKNEKTEDNISSIYKNNTFDLYFPSGDIEMKSSHTIPNGYYNIDDINNYIMCVMIQSGLYLENKIFSDYKTFFINLSINEEKHGTVIKFYPVPTILENKIMPLNCGFELPTTSRTPRIKFCEGLETFLGLRYNNIIPTNNESTSCLTVYSNRHSNISPIHVYNDYAEKHNKTSTNKLPIKIFGP